MKENPSLVYVEKDLDEKVRALTHFTPNHQLDPNDVFLVGYMKAGTTWFRNLVAGAVYGVTSEHTPFSVVWELVPNHGRRKAYYKRFGTPMYFRTHDFPQPEYRRAVYVLRDGRDVVVSLAHHLKAVHKQDVDMAQLIKGKAPAFGDSKYKWNEHVEAWLSNPYGAELLVIKYEDLKKNTLHELRRFCQFACIERDDDLLEAAVANASFEKMREREARLGFGRQHWPQDRFFVRKGQIGSHKEELSPELLAKFLREAGDTLRKAGYM